MATEDAPQCPPRRLLRLAMNCVPPPPRAGAGGMPVQLDLDENGRARLDAAGAPLLVGAGLVVSQSSEAVLDGEAQVSEVRARVCWRHACIGERGEGRPPCFRSPAHRWCRLDVFSGSSFPGLPGSRVCAAAPSSRLNPAVTALLTPLRSLDCAAGAARADHSAANNEQLRLVRSASS